jgi:hypothetical protein
MRTLLFLGLVLATPAQAAPLCKPQDLIGKTLDEVKAQCTCKDCDDGFSRLIISKGQIGTANSVLNVYELWFRATEVVTFTANPDGRVLSAQSTP